MAFVAKKIQIIESNVFFRYWLWSLIHRVYFLSRIVSFSFFWYSPSHIFLLWRYHFLVFHVTFTLNLYLCSSPFKKVIFCIYLILFMGVFLSVLFFVIFVLCFDMLICPFFLFRFGRSTIFSFVFFFFPLSLGFQWI